MKKVLLITAFFFSFPVLIYSVSPEIELSVGFADRFRSGTITPVSLFIRSPDSALNADLVLEFTAGTALREGDRYTFRRSIHLSAGTPGVFRFSLPLEVSSYPLEARLEQRGLVIAEIEKELRPLTVDRPLIVGLSRRPSLDSLIPILGSHFQRPIELVYPRSEFLPASPEAWEGVSLVIWHDLSPEIPDPESLEALGLWIEGGGELIVIGGPWLAGRRFSETLLPGTFPAAQIINGITAYLPEEIAAEIADGIIVYPRGRGKIHYITRDMVSGTVPENVRRAFWTGLSGKLILLDEKETEKTREIERIISAVWFDDEEPLLVPLRGPLLLAGIFSLAAGGLLMAGRRINSFRLRALQLLILLLLSAGVSAAAILKYSPSQKMDSLTPRILKLFVTGNYGSSRLSSRVRFTSPGRDSRDWPLPDGGISTLPGGGDLRIVFDPTGPFLEDLKLEPWTSVELVHETILPGYYSGDRGELDKPGEIRHNGHTTWYDVVLIESGTAAQLVSEWVPGEILTLSETSFLNVYSRIIEALMPVSEETGRIVLARDEEDTIILHMGDGL